MYKTDKMSNNNVPSFVTDLATKSGVDVDTLINDRAIFNAAAKRLSMDLSSYNNSEIAGKCLIWNISRRCSLDTYLAIYKNKLNDKVYKFLHANRSDLNIYLNENDHLNYYNIDMFSATTIISNYLMKISPSSEPMESPMLMFLRVATQLHNTHSLSRVKEVCTELGMRYYIPSSPTLFNSGLKQHQLASCFLFPIKDELKSILCKGIGDVGIVSSMGGGAGVGITSIRHSGIGDRGSSSGVVPMSKVTDKLIEYTDQSGRRKGAATSFLAIWHIDIMEFIEAKSNHNSSHDETFTSLNTCLWTNDLFFRRVKEKRKWTVFCPAKAKTLLGKYGFEFEAEYERLEIEAAQSLEALNKHKKYIEDNGDRLLNSDSVDGYSEMYKKLVVLEKQYIEHKVLDATKVMNHIINVQISGGMPYLCHGDSVNAKSNHKNIGPINQSNLCLEIMEAAPDDTIASCNLSSMNLVAFANRQTHQYDFNKLAHCVRSSVDNLNAVIDTNYYPLDERDNEGNVTKEGNISSLNYKSRPIGLGCSGFSDAMQCLDILPESDEEIAMNKKIFACMYYNALLKSVDMAIERGSSYHYFDKGHFESYVDSSVVKDKNGDIILHEINVAEHEGSPFSNGLLQFDLWKERARVMKDQGILNEKVYKTEDDEPLSPEEWGQLPYTLVNGHTVQPSWDNVKEVIMKYGILNSLLLALMPTASSAQAIRNAETTEYHQANIYTRKVQSGSHTVVNRWMAQELEELGLWDSSVANFIILCGGSVKWLHRYYSDHSDVYPTFDKDTEDIVVRLMDKYKTQFEIKQKHVIKMSRQRGIYIDQSQSFNLYIADPTYKDLRLAHVYGNDIGNKVGMYYLRALPPSKSGSFGMEETIQRYYSNLKDEIEGDTVRTNDNSSLIKVITEHSCCA